MLANLTTLVRSTDAWHRFEVARVRRAALLRAQAELLSYRPHELASDLKICRGDIDGLAQEEADRQVALHLARHPHPAAAAAHGDHSLGMAGA